MEVNLFAQIRASGDRTHKLYTGNLALVDAEIKIRAAAVSIGPSSLRSPIPATTSPGHPPEREDSK
jgi:hypothetical protein